MVTAITTMPHGPPAKSGFDQRGNPTEVPCPFQLQEERRKPTQDEANSKLKNGFVQILFCNAEPI